MRMACITKGIASTSMKEAVLMSSVTSSWRQRRQAARNRRALDRAMAGANTPAMRDELLNLAGSGTFSVR